MVKSIVSITVVFLAFALLHSLLASEHAKQISSAHLGERFTKGMYRFLYVFFSAVTSLAALYAILLMPDKVLWPLPAFVRLLMAGIQFLGIMLGISGFRDMDFMEFIGASQALKYLRGEPVAGDREGLRQNFVTRGVYRFVRHPLYTAGIIIFTFIPVITVNRLAVTALGDIYFIWGALIEEKRLTARFGPQYIEYMKRVPRFIPKI
ncbi:MAG: isoprenylcysteine carboxylmethyltransferase family protein [Nitrospiraceae bacterium]|nr:isoprenylcysteine carboxylmethyltransferase family protein [Nitrospiraceae bacterium]